MEKLKFTDPEVEAAFESSVTTDPQITILGLFTGKLSNITVEVAKRLIKMEDNQVTEKKAGKSGNTLADKPSGDKPKADPPK